MVFGDGLRAWKTVGMGGSTYFLYDGDTLLAELNAAGAITAPNTWGSIRPGRASEKGLTLLPITLIGVRRPLSR
jgi:hypothetical protein